MKPRPSVFISTRQLWLWLPQLSWIQFGEVKNMGRRGQTWWFQRRSSPADCRYHNLYLVQSEHGLLFLVPTDLCFGSDLWHQFSRSSNHGQRSLHAAWCGLCVWVAPLMRDQSAEALTLPGGAGRGALNLCTSCKLPRLPLPPLSDVTKIHAKPH